jgi:hypothetical protein
MPLLDRGSVAAYRPNLHRHQRLDLFQLLLLDLIRVTVDVDPMGQVLRVAIFRVVILHTVVVGGGTGGRPRDGDLGH